MSREEEEGILNTAAVTVEDLLMASTEVEKVN